MSDNIYLTFQRSFSEDRSAIFLEAADGRQVTFSDLECLICRYASVLAASGAMPGQRVAVQVDASPENIALYLATLKIGAIYLPLNTAYTNYELDFFLGDATPAVFIARPEVIDSLEPLAKSRGVQTTLSLGTRGDGSLPAAARAVESYHGVVAVAKDDVAAILYTSGTTGRSKGAMLTHGNLLSNTETLHREWGFVPGDILLHALPLYHIHGLFVAVNIMLLNGGRILLLPRFDAELVIRHMRRATVFMGVPTYYTRLLAHPDFTTDSAENIRLFVSGSAPLLPETFDLFENRTGHRILERYGMSETGMNCSNPLVGERRPGTVGLPLTGVSIRIAGKDGRPLSAGQTGVIEVKGPNVFKGYWKLPEKTAAEFRTDGFFVTGDLGQHSEDGYVTIVGRDKDLIISGGLNVYPKEVEEVLDRLPGIAESAVIALPHGDYGEAVAAVVVRSGGCHLDQETVIRSAAEKLAKFKIPKKVIFVDELPRNSMGKVQKNVLRDQYRECFTVEGMAK